MTGDPHADLPGAAVEEAVADAARLVDGAERVVVLTGAGISTDSGIPDFRGPQGVWTRNPEAEKQSTLSYYLSDPEVRKRSWLSRLDHQTWAAEPNRGHEALVALERRRKLSLIVTQNIDGLHQLAGSDPDRVVEIHGTMRETACMSCGDRRPMQETLDRVRAGEQDPPCELCGGILKSATISFGQQLIEADVERAFDAAARCDLMIAIGSTLQVFPAANVVPIAARAGAPVVILNLEPTEMDPIAEVVVRGSISDVLPRIAGAG